jgi:hypothetical protein
MREGRLISEVFWKLRRKCTCPFVQVVLSLVPNFVLNIGEECRIHDADIERPSSFLKRRMPTFAGCRLIADEGLEKVGALTVSRPEVL